MRWPLLPLLPVLWSIAVLAAFGQPAPVPATVEIERLPGATPRNVVFILSDDHRWDAMSFLGHPLAETPHLDRLAAEGAHLRHALVTTSLCSPSRASILTGLHTVRHGVIDNQRPIPVGTLYFPQYLQEAGYATAFVGKWHMGREGDDPQPGFDRWVSFLGQGQYLPTGNTLNVDGAQVPQRGYITTELTDYAIDWLRQQHGAGKPFFLYLSHKAVHANFTPEEKYAGRLADRPWERPASMHPGEALDRARPRWLRDQRNSWHGVDFPYHSALDIDRYHRAYGETLSSVDDSVGRVLAELEAMGVADDTLVIYMGDNGFLFGEHGLIDKRVAYETSMRVPLLMRCPAVIAPGTVIEEMVANIDIAPTVMEAMGLRPPPHFDGTSLAPLLRGEETTWRDAFLYVYYWERNYPQTPTTFALRGERYKFITYYGLWDADELFDLQSDPAEMHNLFHDPAHAELAAKMETDLYYRMTAMGGMAIPLNGPRVGPRNKRLLSRGGEEAADFPRALLVEEPINTSAH